MPVGSRLISQEGDSMNWWRLVGGILFDVACFVAGSAATLLAITTWYVNTTEQFWGLRLALTTVPLVLVALASTFLRQDPAWRGWLRFALFECVMLQTLGDCLWSHSHWHSGLRDGADLDSLAHILMTAFLNAAVYAVALNVWRLGPPLKRLARGHRLTTACPGPR
jgi:hypothetical protein